MLFKKVIKKRRGQGKAKRADTMDEARKREIENFRKILEQHVGKADSINSLLRKALENKINLILVDCSGNTHYLHEPAASDCLDIKSQG